MDPAWTRKEARKSHVIRSLLRVYRRLRPAKRPSQAEIAYWLGLSERTFRNWCADEGGWKALLTAAGWGPKSD